MKNSKQYKLLFTTLTVVVLFAASCKRKCYDCIVIDQETQLADTLNTLCEKDPQYNSNYLYSWKILCQDAGGETVSREE